MVSTPSLKEPSHYETAFTEECKSARIKTLVGEGQKLMDALAVFADPNNWVGYDDECPSWIFANSDIKDPIEFAHKVINSLRKKSP